MGDFDTGDAHSNPFTRENILSLVYHSRRHARDKRNVPLGNRSHLPWPCRGGGAPLLSLTAKNHQGPTHERGRTTGIQIKFQIIGACHATTEKAGDSLAEITHKAKISHNAVPNYHLTKEASRCPERSRTPLRPCSRSGHQHTRLSNRNACAQHRLGPKHTLDTSL